MKAWMHKAEKIVDDAIPVLLVVFLFVIGLELFFPKEIEPFKNHIDIFDTVLIGIFMSDLFFKYQRIHNFPKFMKKYWLQVIAVIPFYAVFRVMEYLELAEMASTGSKFVNETQLIRGPAMMLRQVERTEGISRTTKLLKFKPLSRLPRLFEAIPFFEKPTGKHHKKIVKAKK